MEQELSYSFFDLHFAKAMMRLCKPKHRQPVGELLCRLLTYQLRSGNLYLDLENLPSLKTWPIIDEKQTKEDAIHERKLLQSKECRDWLSSAAIVTSDPQDKICPLVIQKKRLYLYRYYQYETELVRTLHRLSQSVVEVDFAALQKQWQSYFPSLTVKEENSTSEEEIDEQKLAIALVLLRPFVIISGGPGTGKTTIIAKILELRMKLQPQLRVALAAPTGRAAMRIQQALSAKNLALEVFTLHRLLGQSHDGLFFRHNEENPLTIDLLVIDEASMLDLTLFVRTLRALRSQAQLILLGDHCQLAPVGVGSILSELCQYPMSFSNTVAKKLNALLSTRLGKQFSKKSSPLQDSLVVLNKTFRFKQDSGIARLSQSIRQGKVEDAIACLQDSKCQDLEYYNQEASLYSSAFQECLSQGYAYCFSNLQMQSILDARQRFCILSPFRNGKHGVEQLNASIARWWMTSRNAQKKKDEQLAIYPILIVRNDYNWQLFNGDLGFVRQKDGKRMAYFPAQRTKDIHSPQQELRELPLELLPHSLYEISFVMTIHKSQGSEFDHVVLVLPKDNSPMLVRELIYTAVTRARTKVSVFASLPLLRDALTNTTRRISGIGERLDYSLQGK